MKYNDPHASLVTLLLGLEKTCIISNVFSYENPSHLQKSRGHFSLQLVSLNH